MLNRTTKALIVTAITVALVGIQDVPSRGSPAETITLQTTASSKPPVKTFRELVARLQRSGKKVRRKEGVEQPFLSVRGQILRVDHQDVQVFEYRSVRSAELDAQKITDTRATSLAMWIAPPHFFRSGRLIVLYVGEDSSVLEALTELLGPQLAGK